MPWLSDDSKNRFSVIGSLLKDSNCIDAFAQVDQYSILEEAEGNWIVEFDEFKGENSAADGKYFVTYSSLLISDNSNNHCSGLCDDYNELVEFLEESSDSSSSSSTDCDYTITVNEDTLVNGEQTEFTYDVDLNEANAEHYYIGGIEDWTECSGQELHTSLVFYGTEKDEDLELTDLVEEDFTCEDYSYVDHDLSLSDCYKIELIREIKDTFTVTSERLGIGEFKVETDKFEHVGLDLKFTMKYSFDFSLPPTETKYFHILTTVSSSSTNDVEVQPWLEYPPEEIFELSVNDE